MSFKKKTLTKLIKYKKTANIAFVHIPKCGGTSIYHSLATPLRLSYPDGHIDPIETRNWVQLSYGIAEPETSAELQIIRHAMLNQAIKQKKTFIAGHFTVNAHLLKNMLSAYIKITMLRPPEKRFYSHFKYSLLTRNLATSPDKVRQLWAEYMASDRAKFQANLYAVYLGEADFKAIGETNVHIALSNLKSFDVVGLLENMEEFQKQMAILLGKKINTQAKNTSSERLDEKDQELKATFNDIFSSNKEAIENICRWDIEIYRQWKNNNAL